MVSKCLRSLCCLQVLEIFDFLLLTAIVCSGTRLTFKRLSRNKMIVSVDRGRVTLTRANTLAIVSNIFSPSWSRQARDLAPR